MPAELMKQGVKDRYIGIAIAAVLLMVFMLYLCYLFPILRDMPAVQALLQNPAIQALIGGTGSMVTFEGFLAGEGLNFINLLVGGYIAFISAAFVAGEIEKKTIDLLMSLPLRREGLVLWRYAAMVPIVAFLMLAILVGIFLGAQVVNIPAQISWIAVNLAYIGLAILAFGAIATFVSVVLSDGRMAAIISLVILMVMYLLENVGQSVEKLALLRSLSVFHYVNNLEILINHQLNLLNIGVLLAVIVVFLALAVIAFRRRDIQVV